MLQIEEIKSLGIKEMESGKTLPDIVQSMNAYLGYVQFFLIYLVCEIMY